MQMLDITHDSFSAPQAKILRILEDHEARFLIFQTQIHMIRKVPKIPDFSEKFRESRTGIPEKK